MTKWGTTSVGTSATLALEAPAGTAAAPHRRARRDLVSGKAGKLRFVTSNLCQRRGDQYRFLSDKKQQSNETKAHGRLGVGVVVELICGKSCYKSDDCKDIRV